MRQPQFDWSNGAKRTLLCQDSASWQPPWPAATPGRTVTSQTTGRSAASLGRHLAAPVRHIRRRRPTAWLSHQQNSVEGGVPTDTRAACVRAVIAAKAERSTPAELSRRAAGALIARAQAPPGAGSERWLPRPGNQQDQRNVPPTVVWLSGRRQPGSGTAPVASANCVSYRHGDVVEWYQNGRLGVEQGSIQNRPARNQRRRGGAQDRHQPRARALRCRVSTASRCSGRSERHRAALRICSRDADGKSVPVKMALSESGNELYAAHRRSWRMRYPLKIDPLIGGVA